MDMLEKVYPCSVIDMVLAAFVIKVRRHDGKSYPGSTITNILAALYRVMKENLGRAIVVNFSEKLSCQETYPQLQNALDWQYSTCTGNRN